jgi:hypothetical protein
LNPRTGVGGAIAEGAIHDAHDGAAAVRRRVVAAVVSRGGDVVEKASHAVGAFAGVEGAPGVGKERAAPLTIGRVCGGRSRTAASITGGTSGAVTSITAGASRTDASGTSVETKGVSVVGRASGGSGTSAMARSAGDDASVADSADEQAARAPREIHAARNARDATAKR